MGNEESKLAANLEILKRHRALIDAYIFANENVLQKFKSGELKEIQFPKETLEVNTFKLYK